jgi:hypothetical protein
MATPTLTLARSSRVRTVSRFWPWLLGLGLFLFGGTLLNLYLVWPWMSSWGATPEERQKALPGDDLVPNANIQTTKALTIRAAPEAIYPWLLQLGVDRGGMYSYDWLENLFGLNVHTADTIVPAYQEVNTGDFWRFTPQDYILNPGPGLYVRELQPDHAVLLCFGMENKPEEACLDTWQFVLEPQAGGSTRLLLRSRMALEPELPIKLTYFIQFIMERKMLLEIRERAEGK